MSTTATAERIRDILDRPTMSVEGLAKVLGIGRRQAYDLVRQGKVRSLRAGSRIIVPTSAVRELLDG